MRMYDIIKKKRDKKELSESEIRFFINGYVKGDVPDYQASALLMAIYFNGMTDEETTFLTLAIRDSGKVLNFPDIKGIRVDKHSTGGVGDKTSLIVAPIVASLGIKVAKMSGRGLGHTGGTIDKLESFSGLKTDISTKKFTEIVNKTGLCIVGQSADLAPADKLLYALRDVTATIDSIPLIASSIMGKKLAANDDCIVLDVKTGSGSFMKSYEESVLLAKTMVNIGKKAGKKIIALITDMDKPLGNAIGNSLEVIEAIETLNGNGPKDLTDICLALASNMLYLANYGDLEFCEKAVKEVIYSKKALKIFASMVKEQGGNADWVYNTEYFPKANYYKEVKAPKDGYIYSVDAEGYGSACGMLGAGRNKKDDAINFYSGIILKAKTGDTVKKGDTIAVLYSDDVALFENAEQKLLSSTLITSSIPNCKPIVLDKIL